MKKKGAFVNFLVKKGLSPGKDRIAGLPLTENVTVYSDQFGVPHIYAENESDLMTALGYLHGRDRLWQLESLRRFAAGRLSEIAGPEMVDLDHFSRMAGFKNLQTGAVKALNEKNTTLYQAYVDGINAYIDLCGTKLPLEFSSINLVPEPFTPENCSGALPINAWYLQTNYLEEILAVVSRERMTSEKWNALFPSYPGTPLPNEDFFLKYKDVRIGELLPAALGFYKNTAAATGNSNIWVHADGPGGLPLLANDPHLGLTVPQVWYFCHLHAPGINVCGGSLPGIPGIVIGRNEHIAWGMTNVMTDCCDLYIFDVDREEPTRYRVGRKQHSMTEEECRIKIAGGGSETRTVFRTIHGPVITEVIPGIEAVAAMKWYGTIGEDDWEDTTLNGIFALNRADTKKEFLDGAELITSVGQNIVYADIEGNIGWYATGRIPKRKGYSGRVPADGSSGKCGWNGFHPPKQNPAAENPHAGYIINANNKSIDGRMAKKITYSWAAPYRHDRIEELLKELNSPHPADFSLIQSDIYSKRAELIVPVLTAFTYTHADAVLAAGILENWDFYLSADSSAGLIFQVFRNEFTKVLLQEHLGSYIPIYTQTADIFYPGIDHLLITYPEQPEPSPLIPEGRDLQSLCEEGLIKAVRFIRDTQGDYPEKWSWGRLHSYNYRHPGGKGTIASWLLNRGPYPASGGTDSVNLAFYAPVNPKDAPERQYEVNAVPSLRMIISLADMDENHFVGPMGQSGMPGYPHYDDMIDLWMENRQFTVPLSKEGTADVSIHQQILEAEK